MLAHSWSGNIRELQNRVRRAVLISKTTVIAVSDLNIRKTSNDNVAKIVPDLRPIKDDDAEKQLIIRTLESCNGNKTKAARMLNINPTTLYRKMNKYGIKVTLYLGIQPFSLLFVTLGREIENTGRRIPICPPLHT